MRLAVLWYMYGSGPVMEVGQSRCMLAWIWENGPWLKQCKGAQGLESFSLTLPKPACVPELSFHPTYLTFPSVNGKLISWRCTAHLDSNSYHVWCAPRQSVPISHFFSGTPHLSKFKRKETQAILSAFSKHLEPSGSPSHHHHLKAHRMFDTENLSDWTFCLSREAFSCNWNAATSAL